MYIITDYYWLLLTITDCWWLLMTLLTIGGIPYECCVACLPPHANPKVVLKLLLYLVFYLPSENLCTGMCSRWELQHRSLTNRPRKSKAVLNWKQNARPITWYSITPFCTYCIPGSAFGVASIYFTSCPRSTLPSHYTHAHTLFYCTWSSAFYSWQS